jgi:hypothetical protein
MKALISLSFLLILGISFAQKKDSIQSEVPAYIVKASMGGISANKIAFTDAQWERITPGFQVPDSFSVNPNGNNQFTSNPDDTYSRFSFSFVNNKDKIGGKKYRFMTTIHLGGGPEAQVSKYWFHESRSVIDTLFSNQTGSPYYVFGNRRQDIQKYYKVRSFMVGVGERFALRPDRIFQFETGLDVFFLFAKPLEVKSVVSESYLIEGVNDNAYNSPIPSPVLNSPQISEYSAKSTKGLIVSIPLDISFALSKKNPFWKRMRLGLEANYGIGFQFTKGKTSYNESRSLAFNLRYEFYHFNRHFLSKRQTPASN